MSDNQGYKLASKFVFSENGYKIHSDPYWADAEGFTQDFEFDVDLYTTEGIFMYRTNYLSAMTIIYGGQVIIGLQNVNLNLEHIDSTREPLPDLQFKKRFWAKKDSTGLLELQRT